MPDLPPPPVAAPTWLERCRPVVERLITQRARLVGAGGAALAVAVAASIAVAAWRTPPPPVEFHLPRATTPGAGGAASGAGQDGQGTQAGQDGAATHAYVHAAGAVIRPGVYRVRPGGRVIDVIDAAGGPTPDADLDRLNLAARVSDGQRVYLPRRGETSPPGQVDSGAGDGPTGDERSAAPIVDLNTATLDDLDRLPGIGPATAQAILDLRRRKGRFRAVDELLEVRGIGEAKLAELRPRVRV